MLIFKHKLFISYVIFLRSGLVRLQLGSLGTVGFHGGD